jgi:hypothetical protein
MAIGIALMEVDDVDRWLKSTRRGELLGSLGITGKVFADPAQPNRVGVYADIPDLGAFQAFMQSETAAEAMRANSMITEIPRAYSTRNFHQEKDVTSESRVDEVA